MNLDLLERATEVLGELVDDAVFVGGATLDLFVTESGATSFRPTVDVDLVISAVTRGEYERFAEQLRAREIYEDSTSTVICRFKHSASGLLIDVMGRDASIFGFSNPWYDDVLATATPYELPSGRVLHVTSAPALVATKLAAFADRGASFPLASHDLEDLVRVFDTRPGLVDELRDARPELRAWVAGRLRAMVDDRLLLDAIRGQVLPDAASQRRLEEVVLPRLRAAADLT